MSTPSIIETTAGQVLAAVPSLEDVRELEAIMAPFSQTDVRIEHLVHGRMYARTALIPAGQALVGALTSADNICVVCGDITVTTDAGVRRITGYEVLPAMAGRKRVGVTHADTWWTVFFQTDLKDVEAIENSITSEPEQMLSRRQLVESAIQPVIHKES